LTHYFILKDLCGKIERARLDFLAAVRSGNGDSQKVLFRELQQSMLDAREVGNIKLEISAQLLDIVSMLLAIYYMTVCNMGYSYNDQLDIVILHIIQRKMLQFSYIVCVLTLRAWRRVELPVAIAKMSWICRIICLDVIFVS
jgi:hypothetical protein